MRWWTVLLGIVGAMLVAFAGVASAQVVPDGTGLFDPDTGRWQLRAADGTPTAFTFGDPGDIPLMGDWNCDGLRFGSNFGTGIASANVSNVTFTFIGAATAEVGNSGLGGSGNVAVAFSGNDLGGNTGSISFNGGANTCP